MTQKFGSLPTKIFKDNKDSPFTPGRYTGRHIAAIKCLIALGLTNNYKTKLVKLSYSQLESLTGCSKPMVVEGIKILEKEGLILKVPQTKSNVCNEYQLIFPEKGNFVRLPYSYLRQILPDLPNKGVTALTALRIYLILLQIRPNHSPRVSITYNRLEDYGINRKLIYKALEVLIASNLIRIHKAEDPNGLGYTKTCNQYQIPHLNLPNESLSHNEPLSV
ncbi:hypothetical protein QZK02_13275 [Acinetobacter baumannii]|nr:hypothetical protein [Acinetobacter baumannii]